MSGLDVTDAVLSPLAQSPRRRVSGAFGAYLIERLLGSGGMGDVYLAHDSRLDRKVAIKVLHAEAWGEDTDEGRTRLVREALALAKLSHPNILTVFEVGSVGDEHFLATEYVEGGTLRDWLGAAPRRPRAILDVFVQAGRGLAAAHRAGLVHRDFKPDNLLVDREGRARVADFGLVRSAGDGGGVPGRSIGTPAYMPPEQEGPGADARGDQYAFCVALFEALHGRRPFAGSSLDALAQQKRERRIIDPPGGWKVPAAVRVAILRGMSPDPAARHGSMDELVAILERDPQAVRRRVLLLAGTAAAAGLAVFVAVRAVAPPAAVCKGAAAKLAGVWDPSVKARVQAAFAGTGRPEAADTFARFAAELDRRAAAYGAAHEDACAATAIRHEQSAELLDRRMVCLEQTRDEMAALTGALAQRSDPELLRRAVQAALMLPPVSRCADVAALSSLVPRSADPGRRLAAAAIQARLAELRIQILLGHGRAWLPVARGLVAEARVIDEPAVTAEALLRLSYLQEDIERERSKPTMEEAFFQAARAHDDQMVATVAVGLVHHVVAVLGRFDDAQLLLPAAAAALERAGRPGRSAAELLQVRAILAGNRGDVTTARAYVEEAIALVRRTDPDNLYMEGSLRGDLAIWLRKEGRLHEAQAAARESLALYERTFGKDGWQSAGTLSNLANIQLELGDTGAAEETLRRAVAIAEATFGGEHPQTARGLSNLGNTLVVMAKYEEAEQSVRRALAVQEKVLGEGHPDVASNLDVLAELQRTVGDWPGARRTAERALAIHEKLKETRAGWSLMSLAQLDRLEGAPERGLERARRALAIFVEARGPQSPAAATLHVELARLLLATGRHEEAAAEAAIGERLRREAKSPNAADHAEAISVQADVLQALGRPADALARHRDALAVLERAVPADDFGLARPLAGQGEALLALGRPADAVAPLERAVALRGEHKGGPVEVARGRFALARAVAGPRGRALAQQALAKLAPLGQPLAGERRAIEAWLAKTR